MSEDLPYNDIEQLSSNDKDQSIKTNNNDIIENALANNITIGNEIDKEENDSIYINNEPKDINIVNKSQKSAEIVYQLIYIHPYLLIGYIVLLKIE